MTGVDIRPFVGRQYPPYSFGPRVPPLVSMCIRYAVKVIRSAEDEVQMLLPHVKEAEQFMQLFGREYLVFDVSLQRSQVQHCSSSYR